ncbi:transcription antitermination factor NusB [Pediococcus siamensis]|uniref:transcription antitermination factor NusB n=1 Tax=Pediococcus siamensis TaxID=381829 RepID=UPI0039A14701
MSLNRHQIREAAFQTLFALASNPEASRDALYQQVLSNWQEDQDDVPAYLVTLVDGVLDKQADLNEQIGKYLKKTWSIQRLSRTNRIILEIAFFEIDEVSEVPGKVAVNEALELAKKYADETSKNFINGVLSSKLDEA